MAYRLDWSAGAVEDIDAIAASVGRELPGRAESFVLNVMSAAESIAERPESGRAVPELGREDVRERFVYSYRVCYRVAPEQVVILAVMQGPAVPKGLFQPPLRETRQPKAGDKPPPPRRPSRRRPA